MRAIERAVRTAGDIDDAARARLLVRGAVQPAATAALTDELDRLYAESRGDRRAIYDTGVVPEGAPFAGRTWKARKT